MPSEEFWHPDNRDTLGLIQSAERGQQDRIQRGGDAYAESQGNIGRAVEGAFNAYGQGSKLRQSEEQTGASVRASDSATAINQQRLSEEQAKQRWLDQVDPSTAQNGAPGVSRREHGYQNDAALSDLNLTNEKQRIQFAQNEESRASARAPLQLKSDQAQINSANASTAASNLTAQQIRAQMAAEDLKTKVTGIWMNQGIAPQSKQAQIDALVKANPDAAKALGIAESTKMGINTAQAASANANELTSTSLPGYQHVAQATQKAKAGADTIRQLDEAMNEYTGNLNMGLPAALGGEFHNPRSQAAREQFAAIMDHVTPRSGDALRNAVSLDSASTIMKEFRNRQAASVANEWNLNKSQIDTRFHGRDEIRNADAAVAGLKAPGFPATRGTFNIVNGQNGAGQNSNRAYVQGNQQPGQPGAAVAAPARPAPGQPLQIDWTQFQNGGR